MVEFEINVSSSSECNKITGLDCKCMSKIKFHKKNRFFTKLCNFFLFFIYSCCDKMYMSDLGTSCGWKRLPVCDKEPVITLLSRLFQQVVTPLIIFSYFCFLTVLSLYLLLLLRNLK